MRSSSEHDSDLNRRSRYAAYTQLQAAAVAFDESFYIPEIVAIGGQSDGKSSLLEAFLGFKFNVREVEMGTRRPLIVQMFHNPEAVTPCCRLKAEDSEEYGPPIQPETAVAEAIRNATESHLRSIGRPVSATPIMMRAEYAHCPNLTIIDTPGFIMKARSGEPESTPDEIMDMVRREIEPPHRLILFLQQASVEWCSSLWLHVIQQVDPHCQRTVMVCSKFDNRVKEFAERWEVDRYLSASGYLNSTVRPFFVALPKDRSTSTSQQWRQSIQEVDRGILAYLRDKVAGGFDEVQFGARIGFASLKQFLEDELARKYKEAAPATLAILQQRCNECSEAVDSLATRLCSAQDVSALRRAGLQYVFEVAGRVQALLDGTASHPLAQGLTTAEERASCSVTQWPGVQEDVQPPSADLRLYGGAAFERCLCEFQAAARVLGFPSVAKTRVANVLLAVKLRGGAVDGAATAAQDIARSSAREALAPLMDAATARLAAILRTTFDIALDSHMGASGDEGPQEVLRPYVAFFAALRLAFGAFVADTTVRCKSLLRHHLEANTSQYAALSWVGPGGQVSSTAAAPPDEVSTWEGRGREPAPRQL
ncbi:hypothetical protein WJX73_002091 [Symbiochloris irregularis]|uniref:Dynamin-type G domain-containing protein n=1 Tax=Symbiochloris irregularis TaxID=706552 RepID=A0AAW1NQA0_9CHLO